MYKMIRPIAPVILVLFLSTFIISPAFGKDKEIDIETTVTLYSYDPNTRQVIAEIQKPEAGTVFKMSIKVQGKGNQVTDVTHVNSAFQYIDSYKEQDSSDWVHRQAFILKAPGSTGIYDLEFECTVKDGDTGRFHETIEVIGASAPGTPGIPSTPITKEAPSKPKSDTSYKILPVGSPFIHSSPIPADQPNVTDPHQPKGTVSKSYTPRTSTHRITLSRGWGMFWLGFIVGVIVTAIIYSSGTQRAAK